MNKTLTEADRVTDLLDTGLVDEKGRKVGFFVTRWTAVVTEAPADSWHIGYLDQYAVGTTLYLARVTAARGSNAYGASQPDLRYTTVEQRERDIAKRLAGGKARYTKKYGKVA